MWIISVFVVTGILLLWVAQVIAKHKHLIVLSHGMMGTFTDLNYLENLLLLPSASSDDIKVFKSAKNKQSNSLKGVQIGGEQLASEIIDLLNNEDGLAIETISFVGNSLGGIYARYAISLLHDFKTNLFINNIKPLAFVTIASPHLGVNHGQNYVEGDLQFYVPNAIKYLISLLFSMTGQDMFMLDRANIKDSILYKLATEKKFLIPLKLFKYRRLYANLQNDLLVTLSTASFIATDNAGELRKRYKDSHGIVTKLYTTGNDKSPTECSDVSDASTVMSNMRKSLDNLGWTKVIVNFKNGKLFQIFPLAHNKIAALTKYPLYFWNMFNFYEGKFVMEDLAEFLQQNIIDFKTQKKS